MKKAIITGAAGFAGYSTTIELLNNGYEVYAILKPLSSHNERFSGFSNLLKCIELDCSDFDKIPKYIEDKCDCFFHLAWYGERDNLSQQMRNIEYCMKALKSASETGCSRFVGIGSQAEIGLTEELMTEDVPLNPFSAYGAAKVAALHLSRVLARQLHLEWTWGRIFSLYGDYEPSGRMLPDLIRKLKSKEDIFLSSCEQNWDYLHVKDAAKAIIAIGERGHCNEVYNIAYGNYKPLKSFVDEIKELSCCKSHIVYGEKAVPFVSLQSDISKITAHTGWKPEIEFRDGILRMVNNYAI
jgi:nucleoside-diphosphate-sugar epimerase